MDKKYASQLIKKTKSDFEKIALQFSQTRNWPRPEMRYFVDKYVKSGMKILDIGCGNAHIFELLKNKKVNYLGVDSSKTLITQAREKYSNNTFSVTPRYRGKTFERALVKFVIADALNLKFPQKSFDLIFSFAFLHHIPSEHLRKKILKKIYNFLKPKGFFICTVWNLFSSSRIKYIGKNDVEKLADKSALDFNDTFIPWKNAQGKILAERYYHGFTRIEIKNLSEGADFKIAEIFYEKNGKKSQVSEADNLCIVSQK